MKCKDSRKSKFRILKIISKFANIIDERGSAFLTEQVPISDKLTTHLDERQPLLWLQEKETI